MNEYKKCPVCNATALIYVREVPTVRTKRWIMLYHCTNCRSFCNPSGYVEDKETLKKDLDWNIGVADRNKPWARDLFRKILSYRPTVKNVLEVGCGIGTALKVAKDEFGLNVEGYDLNEYATNWGRENYSLNLHSKNWRSGISGPSDLTLCISCLEHIEDPQPLIHELCEHTMMSRGLLFVSVPFVDPPRWHFIDDPTPNREGTPFFDNDVHITHFSQLGLFTAISHHGLRCRILQAGGWGGLLADACTGLTQRLGYWGRCKIFNKYQSFRINEYLRPGKGSYILREALQRDAKTGENSK